MRSTIDTAFREITIHSPAKINLTLAVHGKRPDGFHELTSLVVALKFGDTLKVRRVDAVSDLLECSNPAVPTGAENLVLKAAAAFRERLKSKAHFEFHLDKRIPLGAGFGGGSGNAVAALTAMNQLLDNSLDQEAMLELAAGLGSDCPFFIDAKPAWMCGRGERLEPLAPSSAKPLANMPVILIKPDISVGTAWAYSRLADKAPMYYQTEAVDKAAQEASIQNGKLATLLYNSFEEPVGEKYLAVSTLLEQLSASGVTCLMSGSGSGCFILPQYSDVDVQTIRVIVQNAWGKDTFWVETSIHS